MSLGYHINCCQNCRSMNIRRIVHLGYLPPVNALTPHDHADTAIEALPLSVYECADCHLVQIGFVGAPEVLFPTSYPYRSGVTKALHDNFADLANFVAARNLVKADDIMIDIGSNDGTLLSKFLPLGVKPIGIEPSDAAKDANAAGIKTYQAYVDAEIADHVLSAHGKASLIVSTNVFAHIDNVHEVVRDMKSMLRADGHIIIENHYLADLVRDLQYDTIYHEHMRYYSAHSLIDVMQRNGLHCLAVQQIGSHGGSVRCLFGQDKNAKPEDSVAEILRQEQEQGLVGGDALMLFARRVKKHRRELQHLLNTISNAGKSVFGIGAPSRASTLVSYCCPHVDLLQKVCELPNSPKIGHFMPGTQIPIVDEKCLFEEKPDYALLLSWHLADGIIPALRRKGFTGKFIIPLPTPHIVDDA